MRDREWAEKSELRVETRHTVTSTHDNLQTHPTVITTGGTIQFHNRSHTSKLLSTTGAMLL